MKFASFALIAIFCLVLLSGNAFGAVDDFEDGTINRWTLITGAGGSFAASTLAEKEGSYGGRMTTDGSNDDAWIQYYNVALLDDNSYNVYTWIRTSNTTNQIEFVVGQNAAGENARLQFNAGAFKYYDSTGLHDFTATPSADTWYRFRMTYNYATSKISYRIYDADNVLIEEHVDLAPISTSFIKQVLLWVRDTTASATTVDFDNTSYTDGAEPGAPPEPPIGYSSILDIFAIGGESFNSFPYFYYPFDGNKTIDFSIWDNNNDRQLLDLNYSDSNHIGSGTVIVKDLNLTSTYCPTQDWNGVTSNCSIVWDYSDLADGNYHVLGRIHNSADDQNTSVSDNNVRIQSTVKLHVYEPIDEDTGLTVVTSAIGYSVKITTDTNLSLYDDLIDANSYILPIQTNDISIKIDVNKTEEYYSRTYSVNTSEVDTVRDTIYLQPYLVAQAVSGNFIFVITNASTTNPIKGVDINISGFIPSGGQETIQSLETDATGQATIPLRLGSPYTITMYYNGTLILTDTITPTSGSLYYRAALNIASTIPTALPIGNLIVSSTPTTTYLLMTSQGKLDLNLAITMSNKTVSDMFVWILDTNGCVYDFNRFTGTWADANKIYYPNVDLNTGTNYLGATCELDTKYALYARIDVNSTDGNHFSIISKKYAIITSESYELDYLLRQLASQLNPSGSQQITTFLALFITLLAASSVAIGGVRDVSILCIMSLALLGFFVFIAWFPLVPFAFLCLVTILMLILVRGAF